MIPISEQKCTHNARQVNTGKRDVFLPCFPLYPPVELFHSFGYCPIVLWNKRNIANKIGISASHVQNYVCSVAANLIDMLFEPGFPPCDAFFSYNACDTLRNLPEIVQSASIALSRGKLTMLVLHIPVNGFHSQGEIEYFSIQIKKLINSLETLSGQIFSTEKFLESVEVYRKIRETVQAAGALVAEGKIEYNIFSNTVMQCVMMRPEKQLEMFESLIQKKDAVKNAGLPVIISGILPPPPEIIAHFALVGLRVAVNDIAAEGRSFNTPTPNFDDPIEYYMKFYEGHHPCTTLLFTADRRIDELVEKAEAVSARGLIFIGEKFCEHEYFEIVHFEEKFKERGIPTLKLEFSRDDGDNYGSIKTRIDAFAELINS